MLLKTKKAQIDPISKGIKDITKDNREKSESTKS